jgi:antitoxin Phd
VEHINLREAKATLSAIVEAAEQGAATTLTKHGRPVAMVVPIDEGKKLYPEKPSLAEYLLTFPGWPEGFEPERNASPGREVDL